MIRRGLNLPTQPMPFHARPAIGRITVSSQAVMDPFRALNTDKPYADQIKPFNFVLSCHIKAFGHPTGVDPEQCHLIAPYETDARKWEKMAWIDRYSGKDYRITTVGNHGSRTRARVMTYGDVLRKYENHPESKCADEYGNVCSGPTIGLLERRQVSISKIHYIGKESNLLDDVDAGLVHGVQEAYTEYPDVRRDEWYTHILPILKAMPLALLQNESGLARSTLQRVRAGQKPNSENESLLAEIAKRVALKGLS
jgi:hypothetical protein